jgi:hypothetical protein
MAEAGEEVRAGWGGLEGAGMKRKRTHAAEAS